MDLRGQMNRTEENMSGENDRADREFSWNDLDNDLIMDGKDIALFQSFGRYMNAMDDLEEVRNDPALKIIGNQVNEMVDTFSGDRAKYSRDAEFVRGSLSMASAEKKAAQEIRNIKLEIHRSNVDDLTAEWVKEWHENRKRSVKSQSRAKEISDFVKSSLEQENDPDERSMSQTLPDQNSAEKGRSSLIIRYVSLSAAAVLGVFLLVRSLLPSFDTEKIYSVYYAPFDMVSPVTRGEITNEPFPLAVQKYRTGDYKSAVASFSEILSKDSLSVASRFLLGLSYQAMNEFDNAVAQLKKVAGSSNTYRKEATWYLGLAYLRTGDKEKAAVCIRFLAQSPGYYSERAKEILRHLK
jgi:TolA-binding protein